MKTINNDIIRQFSPCYDPSEKNISDNETLSVIEWVNKYRLIVPAQDVTWLLCRNEFLTDKDLRLFAVWCAREALKLNANPDVRSIEACNVAERFANGEATKEELSDALAAAWAAVDAAGDAAARFAARAAWADARASARAAGLAAWAAAWAAARAAGADARAAWAAQIDKLLTYFV